MRQVSNGERGVASQAVAQASNTMSRQLCLHLLAWFAATAVATESSAALKFDLRAVSGSQIVIHGPKSVGVNPSSVGGWINFELYAFVNGANSTANDESLQSFAGNMLSTQVGRGAVAGSMINTGEIAPRLRRGNVSPLDHSGSSDGRLQNLDGDPDLEIGSTGVAQTKAGDWFSSSDGMLAGRGDPFRSRNYDGEGADAEFLLYRFTLPIESILAQGLSDMTSIYFSPGPLEPIGLWFEDGRPRASMVGDTIGYGENVLIHTAQTPEQLAAIPEPATWLLGLLAIGASVSVLCRRPTKLVATD